MINLSIFCPNNHLILDAPRCAQCGWERPQPDDIGKPVWGPIKLAAGLGGLGRHVFARPGVAAGVVVFPWRIQEEKREGVLVGLEANSGDIRWQVELGPGERTSAILADDDRLLASLSDVRSLGESEFGRLVTINPDTGQTTTLWDADGHQVSTPALTEEHILVRTSSSALVALSRETEPRELWCRPLNAWWAQPPFLVKDTVIVSDGRPMHGEGYLKAFNLSTGAPRWTIPTDGLLSQAPASSGSTLVYRNGRRQLVSVVSDGREQWSRDYKRIYSPPAAGNGLICISVRGPAPSGQEGHYLLQALEPTNGELAWEMPLPARVRILSYAENTLFAASDHGHVLAYSPTDGKNLWRYTLGSDEDPVRTELVLANDLLFAGTYAGKVVALRAAAPSVEVDSPEAYLEREEYEAAAGAYALKGDYRRAAEIFASDLDANEKAFSLYEHGKLFQQAGELASSLGMRGRASQYFEKAGNMAAVAEELIQNGDLLGGAQVLEQSGELMRAASLYEQAGDLRSSMEVYKRLNNWGKVAKLLLQVSPESKDVQDFEQAGKLKEAGEAAFKLRMYGKAAKLYQEAGEDEYELMALEKLAEEKAEDWGLERMAALARKLGKFGQEAQAWEKLGKYKETAQAYHRAARQAEQVSQNEESLIADLYRNAEYYFDEAGQIDLCTQCRQKVIRYAHLPDVIVKGQPQKEFKEGQWNVITLNITNIGYGIAKNIRVAVGGAQFIADSSKSIWQRKSLGEGVSTETAIHLQHKKGEATGNVPLRLKWLWKDKENKEYSRVISATVYVRDKDDSRSSQTPAQITYNISGDQIVGDRFDGDKVGSGAQKGDRVEIRRGEGVKAYGEGVGQVDTTKGAERRCPNCHLPVEPDAKYCSACRFELEIDV